MNKPVIAQELKEMFSAAQSSPLGNVQVTCICGKCDLKDIQMSDEDFEEMARIINGEPQKETT